MTTITLPARYKDITVGQIAAYVAANTDVDRVAAISGVDKKVLKKYPAATINTLLEQIKEVVAQETESFDLIVKVNGNRYGFIPNLDNITLGEFADIDTMTKDNATKKNVVQLMAILYRPIKDQMGDLYRIAPYNVEDVPYYIDDIKAMSAQNFSGAMAFFLRLRNELRQTILESLELQMKQNMDNLMSDPDIQEMLTASRGTGGTTSS